MPQDKSEDLNLGKSIPRLGMSGGLGGGEEELVTEEVVPQDQPGIQGPLDDGRPEIQKPTPSLKRQGKSPLD